MDNLKNYLTTNLIQFKQISDATVEISNQTFQLIKPNEEGKLFYEGLSLITQQTTEDNYIFELGGQYYYTPKGTEIEAKLNPIKYFGKSTSKLPIPFLGIHSKYEILNGSRDFKHWVKKAKFLGVKTLGLCDRNTLSGALNFQKTCKQEGIKPIIGTSYVICQREKDYRYNLKFYIKDKEGWDNILRIQKEVMVVNNGFIYEKDLGDTSGLYVVADPKSLDYDNLNIKPDFYQLDPVVYKMEDREMDYLNNLKKYVDSDIPPIAIYDAYYLDEDEAYIKRILNTIGKTTTEYLSNNQYFKPFEVYLKEIKGLYRKGDKKLSETIKTALNNLNELCDSCIFTMETGKRHLPQYIMSAEEVEKYGYKENMFMSLIKEGLDKKTPVGMLQIYQDRVDRELEVIDYGEVRDYFLINYDQTNWCKDNGILTGESRGSAAGSLIAYLFGITKIDPIEYDLIFERFLTRGRVAKTIQSEKITVDTEGETLEFWEDDEVKVLIEDKTKYILAKDLTENCEIILKA